MVAQQLSEACGPTLWIFCHPHDPIWCPAVIVTSLLQLVYGGKKEGLHRHLHFEHVT